MLRMFWLFAIFITLLGVSRPAFAAPPLGAILSGAQEVPPNASIASGACSVVVDASTLQMRFGGTFKQLSAAATMVTIRGPASVGTIGPAIVSQSSVTAATNGSFSGNTAVTAPQVAAMLAGNAYCEIADSSFPSGEIRGQLAIVVPTSPPTGLVVLLLALGGLGLRRVHSESRASRAAS